MRRHALLSAAIVALASGWHGHAYSLGRVSPPPASNAPTSSKPAASTQPTPADVRAAIDRGIAFLLKDQNPDGSWGGARGAVYTFTGDVWPNPETHRAWRIGTTGLCCEALLTAPASQAPGAADASQAAADRALDYLLANPIIKQPNEWDVMNNWAYIYGLQALAAAYRDPRYTDSPRRERMRTAAAGYVQSLARFQSLSGGWGYLEFAEPRTQHPQWATSFMTAAAVIAMQDAKSAGLAYDEAVLRRAVRAIGRCRMRSGAFTYSINAIADPRRMEWIDQIKGSLGRIPVCNEALLASGELVSHDTIATGLAHLFRQHRFLDIARNRPIPHETYYNNSGYFYYFGHYYAARLIARLPPDEQPPWWPKLQYEIIKTQQKDGAMWDYDMHAYHKPYGVAFGVMTLARSIRHGAAGP